MDKMKYDNYVAILKGELIPAMGCTERLPLPLQLQRQERSLGRHRNGWLSVAAAVLLKM